MCAAAGIPVVLARLAMFEFVVIVVKFLFFSRGRPAARATVAI